MYDVVIIGGGVIGLSTAWELSRHGQRVAVVDQSSFGSESSWAGAGILPPAEVAAPGGPLDQLVRASNALWPDWSLTLRELTGIDNEFTCSGGLEIPHDPAHLTDEWNLWKNTGATAQLLDPPALAQLEPRLLRSLPGAVRLPTLHQVRNPRHLQALIAACVHHGVELIPHQPILEFKTSSDNSRLLSVSSAQQSWSAHQFVLASGSWSADLLHRLGFSLKVEPVRGQIALLRMSPLPFTHVIESGLWYLVPRRDGRILVGSTEEWVGFDKHNTPLAIANLLSFAARIVPDLAQAALEKAWAGLRPHAPRRRPFIGFLPQLPNLCIATGHFRSGLSLSPITATLVRQLLLNQPVTLPMDDFAVDSPQGDLR